MQEAQGVFVPDGDPYAKTKTMGKQQQEQEPVHLTTMEVVAAVDEEPFLKGGAQPPAYHDVGFARAFYLQNLGVAITAAVYFPHATATTTTNEEEDEDEDSSSNSTWMMSFLLLLVVLMGGSMTVTLSLLSLMTKFADQVVIVSFFAAPALLLAFGVLFALLGGQEGLELGVHFVVYALIFALISACVYNAYKSKIPFATSTLQTALAAAMMASSSNDVMDARMAHYRRLVVCLSSAANDASTHTNCRVMLIVLLVVLLLVTASTDSSSTRYYYHCNDDGTDASIFFLNGAFASLKKTLEWGWKPYSLMHAQEQDESPPAVVGTTTTAAWTLLLAVILWQVVVVLLMTRNKNKNNNDSAILASTLTTTAAVVTIYPSLGVQLSREVGPMRKHQPFTTTTNQTDPSSISHPPKSPTQQQCVVCQQHLQFLPRDQIIDCIVYEVILSHKVKNVVAFCLQNSPIAVLNCDNNHSSHHNNNNNDTNSSNEEQQHRLVPAFPMADLTYQECLFLRGEILRALV